MDIFKLMEDLSSHAQEKYREFIDGEIYKAITGDNL